MFANQCFCRHRSEHKQSPHKPLILQLKKKSRAETMAKNEGSDNRCGCCGGQFRISNFGLTFSRPELFVTSQWDQSKYPILYVLWRVCWSIFFLVWLVLTGVHVDRTSSREENHTKWFIYLTNWAFFLLTLNVLIHAAVTTAEYMKQRNAGGYDSMYGDGMPWYFKMTWVIYNVSIGFSVVTSAAYWGLLYGDDQLLDDINIVTHGVNSAFIIVDILLVNGIPLRIYHVIHPLIGAVVYLIFTLIYDLAGGTNALDKDYIYSVIDWSGDTGNAVLYSVLVACVGLPVVWLILYGLYRIRLLLYSCCCKPVQSDGAQVV